MCASNNSLYVSTIKSICVNLQMAFPRYRQKQTLTVVLVEVNGAIKRWAGGFSF